MQVHCNFKMLTCPLRLYDAIPNVVAGRICLLVCKTTEWKILKFIFIPGIQVQALKSIASVLSHCSDCTTYLGCEFLIIMDWLKWH